MHPRTHLGFSLTILCKLTLWGLFCQLLFSPAYVSSYSNQYGYSESIEKTNVKKMLYTPGLKMSQFLIPITFGSALEEFTAFTVSHIMKLWEGLTFTTLNYPIVNGRRHFGHSVKIGDLQIRGSDITWPQPNVYVTRSGVTRRLEFRTSVSLSGGTLVLNVSSHMKELLMNSFKEGYVPTRVYYDDFRHARPLSGERFVVAVYGIGLVSGATIGGNVKSWYNGTDEFKYDGSDSYVRTGSFARATVIVMKKGIKWDLALKCQDLSMHESCIPLNSTDEIIATRPIYNRTFSLLNQTIYPKVEKSRPVRSLRQEGWSLRKVLKMRQFLKKIDEHKRSKRACEPIWNSLQMVITGKDNCKTNDIKNLKKGQEMILDGMKYIKEDIGDLKSGLVKVKNMVSNLQDAVGLNREFSLSVYSFAKEVAKAQSVFNKWIQGKLGELAQNTQASLKTLFENLQDNKRDDIMRQYVNELIRVLNSLNQRHTTSKTLDSVGYFVSHNGALCFVLVIIDPNLEGDTLGQATSCVFDYLCDGYNEIGHSEVCYLDSSGTLKYGYGAVSYDRNTILVTQSKDVPDNRLPWAGCWGVYSTPLGFYATMNVLIHLKDGTKVQMTPRTRYMPLCNNTAVTAVYTYSGVTHKDPLEPTICRSQGQKDAIQFVSMSGLFKKILNEFSSTVREFVSQLDTFVAKGPWDITKEVEKVEKEMEQNKMEFDEKMKFVDNDAIEIDKLVEKITKREPLIAEAIGKANHYISQVSGDVESAYLVSFSEYVALWIVSGAGFGLSLGLSIFMLIKKVRSQVDWENLVLTPKQCNLMSSICSEASVKAGIFCGGKYVNDASENARLVTLIAMIVMGLALLATIFRQRAQFVRVLIALMSGFIKFRAVIPPTSLAIVTFSATTNYITWDMPLFVAALIVILVLMNQRVTSLGSGYYYVHECFDLVRDIEGKRMRVTVLKGVARGRFNSVDKDTKKMIYLYPSDLEPGIIGSNLMVAFSFLWMVVMSSCALISFNKLLTAANISTVVYYRAPCFGEVMFDSVAVIMTCTGGIYYLVISSASVYASFTSIPGHCDQEESEATILRSVFVLFQSLWTITASKLTKRTTLNAIGLIFMTGTFIKLLGFVQPVGAAVTFPNVKVSTTSRPTDSNDLSSAVSEGVFIGMSCSLMFLTFVIIGILLYNMRTNRKRYVNMSTNLCGNTANECFIEGLNPFEDSEEMLYVEITGTFYISGSVMEDHVMTVGFATCSNETAARLRMPEVKCRLKTHFQVIQLMITPVIKGIKSPGKQKPERKDDPYRLFNLRCDRLLQQCVSVKKALIKGRTVTYKACDCDVKDRELSTIHDTVSSGFLSRLRPGSTRSGRGLGTVVPSGDGKFIIRPGKAVSFDN